MKKKTQIQLRVSEEDKKFLQEVADKKDISVSKILLDGGLKEAKRLNKDK